VATSFFDTSIEFLKGVGPHRAALLNKELGIFTFADLLQHYPFRYEDRTRFYTVKELREDMPAVQLKLFVTRKELVGSGGRQRLVVQAEDETGKMELVWFQGIRWINEKLKPGVQYVVFGNPVKYGALFSMAHPEVDPLTEQTARGGYLQPVYPLTEKLRSRHVDSRAIGRMQRELLRQAHDKIRETLPAYLLEKHSLMDKRTALFQIHFPESHDQLAAASRRLKFEELFYIQLRLLTLKAIRQEKSRGMVLADTRLLTEFYRHHLPFSLTGAQKRVIREIYADLKSGRQMNRLLQGDVGSGKTVVAFACMLIAAGSGAQSALMAPTEILAQQHYNTISRMARPLGLEVALLTGAVKKSERQTLHRKLQEGTLPILIGTHALIEEDVQFHNLGLAVIDEQHRFGVAQRSKLWQKNQSLEPHILVMTATPIPRTLAMTLYGDLDVSVIDELPPGRKGVKTFHRYDSHRLALNGFLRDQLNAGRQIYIVYPLIEESEKTDLKHLMDGYESVCRSFPDVGVSILHGRMGADAKDYEMRRFAKGETRIMVATTVIEVGVDVPNATVMVIENAERFGLAQLHQLRGRVGRGAEQSYCILMTDTKLTAEARKRIQTMVNTTNGFEIAETDLELRGPGDLYGTRQSGILDLLIADLGKDQQLLELARKEAIDLLERDPHLQQPQHQVVRDQIQHQKQSSVNWSRIS
jgi:ATP-dependent DNA helicase RecG